MITPQAVCAVVVTHFPKAQCVDNLVALVRQVGTVLVVDNGSPESVLLRIAEAVSPLPVTLVRLGENRGIAAALNVGIRFAHERGYGWLATLDQDSCVTEGMIERMGRALASCPCASQVALITPRHVDRGIGVAVAERGTGAQGAGWRLVQAAMTSGNLLRLDAALAVGGFDEALFIDFVDYDFCFRLRARGYQLLEASEATLLHSLGSMELRRFGIARIAVTHHSPTRRYYMTRNRIVLWRRHWQREPTWVLRDMRRFLTESARVLLYERESGEKLRMIIRGIRDATRNRLGPLGSA